MIKENNSWKKLKMENLGEVISGGTPKTDSPNFWNGNINWITPTDVTALKGKKYISVTNRKISEEGLKKSSANMLPIGTLIVCTRATIGDSVINKVPISTNQGFKSLITKAEVSSEYMYYWISSNKTELIKQSSGSTFLELSTKSFKSLDVLLPPLPEQQKIAEILSTVDAKIEVIDQQITETQALKKGLMQRLLTKGIGHTEFKDSALGEIPKSWEVVELSDIAKCTVGIATSTTHAYCENGVLLLRNQNIKEGKIALKDVLYITPEFDELNKSKRLREDDIITVRTGYPGISAVVPKELEGSQSFTTLIIRRESDEILSKFLCYYINSEKGKSFFQSNQAGGGQQNVGSKTLESMKIIVPTLSEQNQIIDILISIDDKLEILLEKKFHYQELKQGLMQQLLTGKLRVPQFPGDIETLA